MADRKFDERVLKIAERADDLARAMISASIRDDHQLMGQLMIDITGEGPRITAAVASRLAGMFVAALETFVEISDTELSVEQIWARMAPEQAWRVSEEIERQRARRPGGE